MLKLVVAQCGVTSVLPVAVAQDKMFKQISTLACSHLFKRILV